MNKYISLTDGLTFQRRPTGATLAKVVSDKNGWKDKFRKSVNMDGARILELCDGQLPSGELLAKHNRLYPDNILSGEDAAAFFDAAEKEELVARGPEKIKADVRFAGSYEHYYPQHSTIELTDQCNYRCKHCYRESSPDQHKHLPLEKIKQYISDLWENGGTVVELTGGEPMLHKDFFEVVDFACSKMNMVCILTNGYYLQEQAQQRLLKHKEKLVFNISLDSHKPECHNKFRGKSDAFEKTISAMKLLGENGFLYRVAMSVTPENTFDIEGTITLAKKYGAKLFAYSHVINMGRGEELCSSGWDMSEAAARKMVDYELRVRDENKDFIQFVTVEQANALKNMNCGIVHRAVVLGPDGEIRPCVMFGGDVIKIGNIYEQSFREIFEGGAGKLFSKLHAPKAEVCGDCKNLPYCGNCILRGIKQGVKTPGCKWIEKTGVMKYINEAPKSRTCGNIQDPCQG